MKNVKIVEAVHTCNLENSKDKSIVGTDVKQSNIKHSTSNSAITLIALIITVIVLLILAGITLNIVMGEDGIINKAQLAKEKTNKAQEKEEENLEKLENEITTRTGENYTKLQSTILYPNGTKENPATITANQRIEMNNPFSGHNVYLVAEIYYNDMWGETGFIYERGSGSYGVKATQMQGENIDKIVIQSGAHLMAASQDAGSGWGTGGTTSAPFRVKVFCLD